MPIKNIIEIINVAEEYNKDTFDWDQPAWFNLWYKWSLWGLVKSSPFLNLRKTQKNASDSNGVAIKHKDMNSITLVDLNSDETKTEERNKLPESPINNFAGYQL